MFAWFIKRVSGVLKPLQIFPFTIIVYCHVSIVQRFTFLFLAEWSLKRKKVNTSVLSPLIKTYLMDHWHHGKVKSLVVFSRKQFYHDITPLTFECHDLEVTV